MRHERLTTGQRIPVERNPEYFRGEDPSGLPVPHLGGYLWRVIPDQAVQFNELLGGTIDRMTLKPLQWTRQTGTPEFEQRYRRYSHLANAYTYLGYNLRRVINLLGADELMVAIGKHVAAT